jgi:hypothetical protein
MINQKFNYGLANSTTYTATSTTPDDLIDEQLANAPHTFSAPQVSYL